MTVGQTDLEAREHLREFLTVNFLYLRPELELRDEDDLLELGVLDSMGLVELVEEVQEHFGLVVDDVEITEENFGSISGVVGLVLRKRAG